MEEITEKARNICALYHAGKSVTVIANEYKNSHSVIIEYLQRWYYRVYGEDYENFTEKRAKRIVELKSKFDECYEPFIYSRAEMCRLLDCTATEFELMLKKYSISYLRLQTYRGQKTYCNIPLENYKEYKEFCEKHNMSMRELACVATNEYILNHIGGENDDK